MLRFAIAEHGRILRAALSPRALRQLQSLDERLAMTAHGTVLDWTLKNELRAKSWVGVLQVPGISIEILPKIDVAENANTLSIDEEKLAQRNLLYMLSLATRLPFRERDLASLATPRAHLLEALIRIFADSLLAQLRNGANHSYVRREDNCSVVKGRILFAEHIKRNLAQPHRLFLEFDEFATDTMLNRVLKAACASLLRVTQSSWTARCLREALVHFSDVSEVEVRAHELEAVSLDRNSQRFEAVFEFARIILQKGSPAPEQGMARTFSLLFPMEKVFEEFVGAFVRNNASTFGLTRDEIHLQARGERKWLLRAADGDGHVRLKPDILIGTAIAPRLIIDTKWKRLVPDIKDRRCGVSREDIYQLFAYAERFKCRDNILLFPKIMGATSKRFRVDEGATGKSIRIEFLNMSRDLFQDRGALRAEVRELLHPAP